VAKIAFIGAGSVIFAKNLLCDILLRPALADSEICLMDIDPERLRVAETLARRVVAQLDVPAKVSATLDLRKACRGARYAITMIQVGGYKPGTLLDFEIPKKYGLRQTIGDTLGVGGIFRALRTLPELVKVARALEAGGDDAPLLLNYSNPMAMNMMGIERSCGLPAVGLCHSVQGTTRQLAQYAGLPPGDVSCRVAGINHVAFFLEFKYRGQDAYPLLFRAMEDPHMYSSDKVRFEMMRRLGYFVTESSEHFAEYCPWFIHHGPEMVGRFGIPLDEYLRRCESILATWKKTEKMLLAAKHLEVGTSVEYGSQIIHAIESGHPDAVHGNVPNRGLITNLPSTACVEVPCLVDAGGLQPTVVGDLPPQLAAMCRSNIAVQELAVEAFLTGRREHIYHAAMMDPHTASQLPLDQIWAVCDDLIAAHQHHGLLGQFKPTAANTGRTASTLERIFLHFEPHVSPSAPQNTTTLLMVVENGCRTPFRGCIACVVESGGTLESRKSAWDLRLAPGQTRRIPIRVRRSAEDLLVNARSTSPHLLVVAFAEARRREIRAGSGRDAAAVRVTWSGNTLAAGRMALTKTRMTLDLRITDTDISVRPKAWWDGSVLELFARPAASPAGAPTHLIVLPEPARPRVIRPDGKTVPGTRVSLAADKGGYDVTLSIPLRAFAIKTGEPFLVDMRIGVNALGDAHGRVRQSWQGSRSPHLGTSGFALVKPV
jgi:alpha-galactosidase/6-phospho-beta-glucosidase family protein